MANTVNYNGATYNWDIVSSYFDFVVSDTIDWDGDETNEETLAKYIAADPEFADLFEYDFNAHFNARASVKTSVGQALNPLTYRQHGEKVRINMKNPKNYFEKNGFIYGDSYKYNFGRWEHRVQKFDSYEEAEKWLYTEEYDFRTRELISKAEARKYGCNE